MRPPLSALNASSKTLHESYPERIEGYKGNKSKSIEEAVIPPQIRGGRSCLDVVGEPGVC